jgi:hypothetical protein
MMSDTLPPDLEPPSFEPPAPAEPTPWAAPGTATPMEPSEPASKNPAWKSWLAAGVVTAAFAGGAIVAISLAGGKDSSNNTPAAATTDQDTQSSDGFGGNGSGPALVAQRGARGTIAAIDGPTLTLDSTDPSGEESTVTVETTDATTFRETVEGTLDDIAVGDNIVAMGTATDAGITAANIMDNGDDAAGSDYRAGGPPPAVDGDVTPRTFTDGGPDGSAGAPPDGDRRGPGAGGFTAGTVKSIDGTTITVETADGSTVTVATTADTTTTVTKAITLADLAVGDTVSALGTTEGSTVTADTVQKGDLAFGRGGMRPPDGGPPDTSTD